MMVTVTPASTPSKRDWLSSGLIHAAVLTAFLWLGSSPHVQRSVQTLDLELSWAPQQPVAALETPAPPREPQAMAQPPQRAKPATEAAGSRKLVSQPEAQSPGPPVAPPAAAQQPATPDVSRQAAEAATAGLPEETASPDKPAPAAKAPAAPPDDQAHQQWRSRLEQALQRHKLYPPAARRMGQSGRVTVHLRLAADGTLLASAISSSSGFKALDEAAEHLVRSVASAMKAHAQPGRATSIDVPIVYELTES